MTARWEYISGTLVIFEYDAEVPMSLVMEDDSGCRGNTGWTRAVISSNCPLGDFIMNLDLIKSRVNRKSRIFKTNVVYEVTKYSEPAYHVKFTKEEP